MLKKLTLIFLLGVFVFALAACNSNDEAANTEVEDVDDNGSEDVRIPTIIPMDVPVPNDAIESYFNEEENNGRVSFDTSMNFDELEVLYDEFFHDSMYADIVVKEKIDHDNTSEINFTIQNPEIYFLTNLVDHGEVRTVSYIYWDYSEENKKYIQ